MQIDIDQAIIDGFKQYSKEIYNYVYYRVNANQMQAEDIAQETFMKAWKYRHSFKPELGSMRTWLYTICKGLLIDSYKTKRHEDSIDEKIVVETEPDNFDTDLMHKYVVDQLNKLPQQSRELIILKHVNQYSLHEIAELTNKSYGAVKVSMHRALESLKAIINSDQ